MIQAVQIRDFAANNSLVPTKSCCQKMKEVLLKVWLAIKRAIDALMRPCKFCCRNYSSKKKDNSHVFHVMPNAQTDNTANIRPQNVIQEVPEGGIRISDESKNEILVHYNFFESIQREAQGVSADQLTKGFLFEIKDNVGVSKGYLFGTIHDIPRDFHWLHESIIEKFQQSTCLGVEYFSDDEPEEDVALEEILNQFFYDPGLDQGVLAQAALQVKLACIQLGIVTPHDIETLDQIIMQLPDLFSEDEANRMKNRMTLQFYGEKWKMPWPEENSALGMDARFISAAVHQNKPIINLENTEVMRKEMFKLEPVEYYREFLGKNMEELIRDRASTFQFKDRLFDTWKRGDFVAFARHYEQYLANKLERARYPGLLDIYRQQKDIQRARNILMADTVDQFIRGRGGKLMAAFGCSHLVGQDGVIDLLRQRGWTAQQVGAPQNQVPEVPIQLRAAGE